jgi:hypothetical protein
MQVTFARNSRVKQNIKLSIQAYSNIICIYGFEPKFIRAWMCTCEKSSPPHELSYFALFSCLRNNKYNENSHLNLFHVNIICRS